MSPNERHLQAAEGFLALGLPLEAIDEVESIDPEHRMDLPVVVVRVGILRVLGEWAQMEVLARLLSEGNPQEAFGWINWAYAARRVRGLVAARDILWRSLRHHQEVAGIQYNLACYECQLGRLVEARENLSEAFRLGRKYRQLALNDPDLAPLHAEIRESPERWHGD